MRWWAVPSWFGDFRLEPVGDGETRLIVERATPQERALLSLFMADVYERGWVGEVPDQYDDLTVMLSAPLAEVGPALVSRTQPQDRTLTAVKFADGHLEVCESSRLGKLAKKATKEKADVAVSVKRPTPSCPQCEPGAVRPASEVLLAFLDDQQHRDWAEHRAVTVLGGDTYHTYLVAHRHSPIAIRLGRMCFDVSDQAIMHFYDWSVPPEEEVLATMLILQAREPWLRNEATKMRGHVFKNPFGDKWEGYDESVLLGRLGQFLRQAGIA